MAGGTARVTEVSPADRQQLMQLVAGQMAGQVLVTAVRLGLADLIGDDERTGAELAEASGAHAGAMTRLLRALAALGLLVEARPGSFRLTGAGMLLRTDRPDSMDVVVKMYYDPVMADAWQGLERAVRTGRTAFDEMFGTDYYTYLAEHPELSERFNVGLGRNTFRSARLVPAHYEFSRFHTVADIGGGDGTLIAEVLRGHPGLRGILFDTAEGLAQADATLRAAGVAERCTTRAGDFFAAVPEGADLYMLKSVIHNWDDERAGTILGHCRKVIPGNGQLLIIESVLPDMVDSSVLPMAYLSDLAMLIKVGGRNRTRDELDVLCRHSGFALTEVTRLPPPATVSLIEAAPA